LLFQSLRESRTSQSLFFTAADIALNLLASFHRTPPLFGVSRRRELSLGALQSKQITHGQTKLFDIRRMTIIPLNSVSAALPLLQALQPKL
jgi:hypothetical protein